MDDWPRERVVVFVSRMRAIQQHHGWPDGAFALFVRVAAEKVAPGDASLACPFAIGANVASSCSSFRLPNVQAERDQYTGFDPSAPGARAPAGAVQETSLRGLATGNFPDH
jgi:hypothetical protein